MRVILLQDIENLGKKHEIKEVKNGHARNFLIPKGLVKPATPETIKWLEIQKEIESKKAEEELKGTAEFVSKIDGLEVTIPVKLGEKGQFFEKITNQKVSEKLKIMGFDIKKDQIEIKEPIKEIGEFPVKVKFEHNLEAEIKIIIASEEKNKNKFLFVRRQ